MWRDGQARRQGHVRVPLGPAAADTGGAHTCSLVPVAVPAAAGRAAGVLPGQARSCPDVRDSEFLTTPVPAGRSSVGLHGDPPGALQGGESVLRLPSPLP